MNFPDTYDPNFQYPSESWKYLSETRKYLDGLLLDLGSGGWPVAPHAIQVELPPEQFAEYTGGRTPAVPIQIHGTIFDLPFKDNTVDCVYASHLLEDFTKDDWYKLLTEWKRVIKPTGYIVILTPEHDKWQYCVQVLGQCPNCAHKHEPSLGEVGNAGRDVGLKVIEDRLTSLFENDYTILTVFQK